jgi:hypothetical protein
MQAGSRDSWICISQRQISGAGRNIAPARLGQERQTSLRSGVTNHRIVHCRRPSPHKSSKSLGRPGLWAALAPSVGVNHSGQTPQQSRNPRRGKRQWRRDINSAKRQSKIQVPCKGPPPQHRRDVGTVLLICFVQLWRQINIAGAGAAPDVVCKSPMTLRVVEQNRVKVWHEGLVMVPVLIKDMRLLPS